MLTTPIFFSSAWTSPLNFRLICLIAYYLDYLIGTSNLNVSKIQFLIFLPNLFCLQSCLSQLMATPFFWTGFWVTSS